MTGCVAVNIAEGRGDEQATTRAVVAATELQMNTGEPRRMEE